MRHGVICQRMSKKAATPHLLKLHGTLDMPDFSADIFFAQLGLEVDETWQGCATFMDIYKLWDARLIVGRWHT